ncbi:uncharacterized protein LOC126297696 isoform X1 [Schistocerca gregaria]|uniref:uncharacterized protein LOC126297696 isoform X1 n=1 Tax=Schistocerca gregaria TaxID=7010 RepID=UPI00211EB323|nr:uncharacterized protein LOC126297696 isoform X1 [Schistocerca gregaria]
MRLYVLCRGGCPTLSRVLRTIREVWTESDASSLDRQQGMARAGAGGCGGPRWQRRLSLPEAVMRRYAVQLAQSDDSEDARASEPAPSPPATGSEWSTGRSGSSRSTTLPYNNSPHSEGNLEILDSAGRTSSSGTEANSIVPELPTVINCKPCCRGASPASVSCPSSRASVGCQSGEPSTTVSSSFRTAINVNAEDGPRNCCAESDVTPSSATATLPASHSGDTFLAECVRFLERTDKGMEPLTPTSGCSTSNPRSKSSSSNGGYLQFLDRPATPSSSSSASVKTIADVQRARDTFSACSKRDSRLCAQMSGRDSVDPCAAFNSFTGGSGCVSRADKAISANVLPEVGGGCDVIAGSSYCEGERAQVCVARYSALPRSVSMLVNVSSAECSSSSDEEDSESGLSLVDSLEDTQLKAFFVPVGGSGPRPATERALALSLPRSLHRKLSERRRQLIERQRRCREQHKLSAPVVEKRDARLASKLDASAHLHKKPTLSLPDINQPRRACRRLSPLVYNESAKKAESNHSEANWKSTSIAPLPQDRQPTTDKDSPRKTGASSEIQTQEKRHNCATTFLPPPRHRLDTKTSQRDSAKVIRRHSCINNTSASPRPKLRTSRRTSDSIQKIKKANNETAKPISADTAAAVPPTKNETPILDTLEPLEPNAIEEENVPLLIPDNSYNEKDEKTEVPLESADVTSHCKPETNSVNGTDKFRNLAPAEDTRDRTNCPKPLLKSVIPTKPLLKSAVPVKKWTSTMYGKKVPDSEAIVRPNSRKPSRLPVRKLSRLLPPAPSPCSNNLLSGTYCHRFEVIPEERSASLDSSNEDTVRSVADRSRQSSLCNKLTKKELDNIESYKGKEALSNENDLLSISKGWINFYLLKENRLEDTPLDERGGRQLTAAAAAPATTPAAAPTAESSPAYSSDSPPSPPPLPPARRRHRARQQPAPLPRPASPASPACAAATGWSVTVAANLHQSEELEMRLSFPACVHSAVTSQSDSGVGEENSGCLVATPQPPPPALPPTQPRFTLTLRSRAQRSVNHITELPHSDKRQFQYFPDVNNTTGLNKSSKKSTKTGDILLPITTHSAEDEMKRQRRLSVPWPDLHRSSSIVRKRTAYPSTTLQTLSVKGCAITPERKSHFRSASERDISRAFAT